MSTLQENLDAIKLDKDTNLKPENLKAGNPCLGVSGTNNYNVYCDANSSVNVPNIAANIKNVDSEVVQQIINNKGCNELFSGMQSLLEIPDIDTAGIGSTHAMFMNCRSITTIPYIDTSKAVSMMDMFNGCSNLLQIPQLDTSNCESAIRMFRGCSSLTSIPLLDFSKVKSTHELFNGCGSLQEVPALDLTSCTYARNMFLWCSRLTSIPMMDFSKVTDMYATFKSCENLVDLPLLNTSSNKTFQDCFKNCLSLSDESLNNILHMVVNSSSGAKTLSYIGLTSEQATKCTTLSNYQAFLDAGWTTGY